MLTDQQGAGGNYVKCEWKEIKSINNQTRQKKWWGSNWQFMTFSWLKSEGRNWKQFQKGDKTQQPTHRPGISWASIALKASEELAQVKRTGWWLNAHNLPYHVVGRVWPCSYVLLKIKNCNQTKACLYFSRYCSDEISTNPSQHISISLIWRNENHEIWIRLDICVKRVYNHFGLLDKNVIAGPVR